MLLVGLDLPLKVLPLIRLLLVHVHAATDNQYVCMPIEKIIITCYIHLCMIVFLACHVLSHL